MEPLQCAAARCSRRSCSCCCRCSAAALATGGPVAAASRRDRPCSSTSRRWSAEPSGHLTRKMRKGPAAPACSASILPRVPQGTDAPCRTSTACPTFGRCTTAHSGSLHHGNDPDFVSTITCFASDAWTTPRAPLLPLWLPSNSTKSPIFGRVGSVLAHGGQLTSLSVRESQQMPRKAAQLLARRSTQVVRAECHSVAAVAVAAPRINSQRTAPIMGGIKRAKRTPVPTWSSKPCATNRQTSMGRLMMLEETAIARMSQNLHGHMSSP
mmetsp:Transcript_77341/g.238741  ORF Transcript_77341/g.238741 Transcript_77341/m.238741 type:complete len:268 (+) Transcript_77341:104-907(+)